MMRRIQLRRATRLRFNRYKLTKDDLFTLRKRIRASNSITDSEKSQSIHLLEDLNPTTPKKPIKFLEGIYLFITTSWLSGLFLGLGVITTILSKTVDSHMFVRATDLIIRMKKINLTLQEEMALDFFQKIFNSSFLLGAILPISIYFSVKIAELINKIIINKKLNSLLKNLKS